MSEYDKNKCLELTTSMTLQAMQSGKLDAGNAEAVSNFFLKVYLAVADCAALDKPTIEEVIRRFCPVHVVQPDS